MKIAHLSLILLFLLTGITLESSYSNYDNEVLVQQCDEGEIRLNRRCIKVSDATDEQIKKYLISRSIASYSGSCPCPYNTDRAGRRCGKRSAYSKPGGASPLCYTSDISKARVQRFRDRYSKK